MSSLNSRLKSFGFGKRNSAASIATSDAPHHQSSVTPPPQPSQGLQGPPQIPQQFSQSGPAPSITFPASSSQQSLPNTMNHPGAGPRPPSFPSNFPPGGAPQIGRMSPAGQIGPARTPPSQMLGGPPPINTGGAPVQGYPPQMQQQMGPGGPGGPPPPGMPGGPPGYPGATGYPPPAPGQQPGGMPPQQQFGRPGPPPGGPGPIMGAGNPGEADGQNRSKAQLIVGIDFVRHHSEHYRLTGLQLTELNRAPPSPVSLSLLLPTTRPRKTLSQNGRVPVPTRNKRWVHPPTERQPRRMPKHRLTGFVHDI
jgi:hypothetical protein